jgi:hypothetical protein
VVRQGLVAIDATCSEGYSDECRAEYSVEYSAGYSGDGYSDEPMMGR